MQRKVQYISELGVGFDTPELAIEDDKRLPMLIRAYKEDLKRMENGKAEFGSRLVDDQLKEAWRKAIAGYEAAWERAQTTWDLKVEEDLTQKWDEIEYETVVTHHERGHVSIVQPEPDSYADTIFVSPNNWPALRDKVDSLFSRNATTHRYNTSS